MVLACWWSCLFEARIGTYIFSLQPVFHYICVETLLDSPCNFRFGLCLRKPRESTSARRSEVQNDKEIELRSWLEASTDRLPQMGLYRREVMPDWHRRVEWCWPMKFLALGHHDSVNHLRLIFLQLLSVVGKCLLGLRFPSWSLPISLPQPPLATCFICCPQTALLSRGKHNFHGTRQQELVYYLSQVLGIVLGHSVKKNSAEHFCSALYP